MRDRFRYVYRRLQPPTPLRPGSDPRALANPRRRCGRSPVRSPHLRVDPFRLTSAVISGGKATIHLSGTYKLGGACHNPRLSRQIEQTALQFSTVKQVAVFINGVPLDTILTSK